MAKSKQMCLSCSVRPATKHDGTVPLCAKCDALVNNTRGVQYEKPGKKKTTSATVR